MALYCREPSVELYHKADLARACAQVLGMDEEGALWLLFRGTRGKSETALKVLQQLVDCLEVVIQENAAASVVHAWTPLALPEAAWCPEGLDAQLMVLFYARPDECTPAFATRFHLVHGETHAALRAVFARANTSADELPAPMRALHRDIVQGSEAWLALQRTYNAHSFSGAAQAPHALGFAAQSYCVVRGCILEALACEALTRAQPPNHRVLQLGMLVDEVTREAISPDLVVVCPERVIVYEVKGVFGAKDSAHHQRAMWLATRQLSRAARMLTRVGLRVECRIVLVYVAASSGRLTAWETPLAMAGSA
jgi:hypothetical protein